MDFTAPFSRVQKSFNRIVDSFMAFRSFLLIGFLRFRFLAAPARRTAGPILTRLRLPQRVSFPNACARARAKAPHDSSIVGIGLLPRSLSRARRRRFPDAPADPPPGPRVKRRWPGRWRRALRPQHARVAGARSAR